MLSSALLEVYVDYATGGSMTGDYSVFQIVQPWVENEATWENASKDVKWVNAGGDYVSKAIVKGTWLRSNGNAWMKFNVLSAVQNFVKLPDMNYGFLIRNVSGAQEIDLPASEHATAEFRPKLTITYEEGVSTVAPKMSFARSGVTIRARPRGLDLQAGAAAPELYATLCRPDGRAVLSARVAPGNNRSVAGLAPGIYLLTIRQTGRTERATVLIVP